MVSSVWSSTVFSRITRAVAATGHRVSSHPYLQGSGGQYFYGDGQEVRCHYGQEVTVVCAQEVRRSLQCTVVMVTTHQSVM